MSGPAMHTSPSKQGPHASSANLKGLSIQRKRSQMRGLLEMTRENVGWDQDWEGSKFESITSSNAPIFDKRKWWSHATNPGISSRRRIQIDRDFETLVSFLV